MAKEFGWSLEDIRHTPADTIQAQYKRLIDWKKNNPNLRCPFLKAK